MTPIADRISHLSDRFEALIEGVSPVDWGNQSPCDEWSAHATSCATSSTSIK